MSIVNKLEALDKELNGLFQKAYDNGEHSEDVLPFVTRVDSSKKEEDYGWLGSPPVIREFKESRVRQSLTDYKYLIENKKYEGTVAVTRDSLEDDRLDAIRMRVTELAVKSRNHLKKIFFEAVNNSETLLGYDGQPFISDTHPTGQSNKITSRAIPGVSHTLDARNIIAAIAKIRSFKDENGEPYNENDVEIGVICHPSAKEYIEILNVTPTTFTLPSIASSLRGKIKYVLESSRLENSSDYYVCNIGGNGVRPFIYQDRISAEFVRLTGGDKAFDRDIWEYGVRSRERVGYGLWQNIVKVGA